MIDDSLSQSYFQFEYDINVIFLGTNHVSSYRTSTRNFYNDAISLPWRFQWSRHRDVGNQKKKSFICFSLPFCTISFMGILKADIINNLGVDVLFISFVILSMAKQTLPSSSFHAFWIKWFFIMFFLVLWKKRTLQKQPRRLFSKVSVLFFQEHLFLDFPGRLLCVHRTDTDFPKPLIWLPNRYRFFRSTWIQPHLITFDREVI